VLVVNGGGRLDAAAMAEREICWRNAIAAGQSLAAATGIEELIATLRGADEAHAP
jgi:hypothetical protein